MRKQCSGSFSGFVQKGRGSWIKKGLTLKGLSFLLCLDIRVRVHPSRGFSFISLRILEIRTGRKPLRPFCWRLHRRLWAFCFSISSLQKDLWTWLPLQHPCQPPSRVSFAQDRAFLVCLISSKVTAPTMLQALGDWAASYQIYINTHLTPNVPQVVGQLKPMWASWYQTESPTDAHLLLTHVWDLAKW